MAGAGVSERRSGVNPLPTAVTVPPVAGRPRRLAHSISAVIVMVATSVLSTVPVPQRELVMLILRLLH